MPPQPVVESIRIEINSQPQGASLLIDGRRFEEAPAVLSVSAQKSEVVVCAQWPAQVGLPLQLTAAMFLFRCLNKAPISFAAGQE